MCMLSRACSMRGSLYSLSVFFVYLRNGNPAYSAS